MHRLLIPTLTPLTLALISIAMDIQLARRGHRRYPTHPHTLTAVVVETYLASVLDFLLLVV